jgi:NADH dehydrogenase FAD-containing subunit
MKDVIIIGGGAAGILCAAAIKENSKEFVNVTIVERAITNTTAAPIPAAVLTFVETPKKGQIPRNCERITLFTNTAKIIIYTYSIA